MADSHFEIPDEEYRHLRERLITFFRLNGRYDPEANADEVICRTVRRLREGAQLDASLAAFCLGIARNVLREARKERLPIALASDPVGEKGRGFANLSRVEQVFLLNECLSTLPPAERKLLLEYHLGDRADLAKRRNQSPNALRIQIHRISKAVLRSVQAPRQEMRHPKDEAS